METAAQRVSRAMSRTDRRLFLPVEQQRLADADLPLPIGHGATCSQPSTVARMLELLDVRPGQAVLDVGCGSGWTTALLDHLVAPAGTTTGVELEPALVRVGAANLAHAGRPGPEITQAIPGVLGRPDLAPFDRVLVSAEADALPEELVAQLAPGGRLVIPVSGELYVVDREPEATTVRREGTYRFVPLRRHPDSE